jgi:hypothetical protein
MFKQPCYRLRNLYIHPRGKCGDRKHSPCMGVGVVRELVMRAGAVISAKEVGHRALVFRKLGRPGESNLSRIQVGLQLTPRSEIVPLHAVDVALGRLGRVDGNVNPSVEVGSGRMARWSRQPVSSCRRTLVSLDPFVRRRNWSCVLNAMLAYYVTSSRGDALNCRLLPVDGRGEHVPGAVAVSKKIQHTRTRSG